MNIYNIFTCMHLILVFFSSKAYVNIYIAIWVFLFSKQASMFERKLIQDHKNHNRQQKGKFSIIF